ncbi:hypothetical protein [uncultured Treponema sp.]|uniref:hypothetical protein n=1 Tax=uncultured Treponema sp. TaxID=162155 RepID=UPI0025D84458|nr:hypothetical protein [uncultured Treponema sp.]
MKKSFLVSFGLFLLTLLTSCTSSMINAVMGPQTGYKKYGNYTWGTSPDAIRKEKGWQLTRLRSSSDVYFIGMYTKGWGANNYYEEYEPHGPSKPYIEKTLLYFTDNRLYAVEDEFKETPSVSVLHRQYGEFSEKNIVTSQQKKDGIEKVYRSQPYFDDENLYALEIQIYSDGKTVVNRREPFLAKSRLEKSPLNNWVCYSALDSHFSATSKSIEKRIDFTFLNQNKDGKYLFIGYSKGLEQANISYVRAGVCWGDNASGVYDIKGNSDTISKKYSSEKWNCRYNGKDYSYTNNAGESAREIVKLFLESEKVMVRHDNSISEFVSSGNQLQAKMAEYGITWEEIDAALSNEEF